MRTKKPSRTTPSTRTRRSRRVRTVSRPTVFLGNLTLRRFRSCEECTIALQPDLTVLVGENNGGKSNIIDAVRLLTPPLNGRRDRYAEDEDLRRGSSEPTFEIVGEYHGLSDNLKGLLISAVPDPTKDVAIFGYRYETRSDKAPRGQVTLWAGKFDSAEPETGSTGLIRHVFLPALRDAHQALGSGSGSRVMALFRHFIPKGQEQGFLDAVKRTADTPPVLGTVNTEIGTALNALTSGVRPQQTKLDFASEELIDVARSLRFKLADAGISLEDIKMSGLGYANLLFMATVVVELTKAREADLTLFLVEEPEAHLHPQLQMLVLEFLLAKARESRKRAAEAGQPEGRIQVVVSTHSPNLTAWVPPKHLVVVRSQQEPDTEARTFHTASVPIALLGIKSRTMAKISRYLDVTRSSLLFGNAAILVEGVAEALLLPVIARDFTLKDDRDAWLRFRSTPIVAIDGVDFRPYVEILLRPHEGVRIADRVVVLTDADPQLKGNRKGDLEELASSMGAGENLHVLTNQKTLEHELLAAGNEATLKEAFGRLHPRLLDAWADRIEGVPSSERPNAFLKLLDDKDVRKGDFAQEIAGLIEDDYEFYVPAYLERAIRRAAEK